MKIVRTILRIVLCTAIAAMMGLAFYNNHVQNHSGRYSSVTTISDTERDWIMARFGHKYESIEEYISTVQAYVREHFHYDRSKNQIFQHFDFDDIEQGDTINGICFDFSVILKHITLALYEEDLLPVEDIKVYVTDVSNKNIFKPHHSYNIISLPDGRNYYIDLTASVVRVEKGLEPGNDYETFTCSIKEYCKRYKELLLNLH